MAYVYKITFEEVPHFYIGVRGRDPEGDPYLGTPKTHKCYWEIYTPKKQVLWVYDSWGEACDVEIALIMQNWDNRYCLNECAGRAVSSEARAKGGVKAAKTREELRRKNPEYDAGYRANCAKGAKALHERRRKNPEYDAKVRANWAKGNVKKGKITGAQRWQCTVTGHISPPGPLSRYQKKRGIDTKNRKRLPPTVTRPEGKMPLVTKPL